MPFGCGGLEVFVSILGKVSFLGPERAGWSGPACLDPIFYRGSNSIAAYPISVVAVWQARWSGTQGQNTACAIGPCVYEDSTAAWLPVS